MESLRGAWLIASSEWGQTLFLMLLPWMPLGVLTVLPANSGEVREGATKQSRYHVQYWVVQVRAWDILGDFVFLMT